MGRKVDANSESRGAADDLERPVDERSLHELTVFKVHSSMMKCNTMNCELLEIIVDERSRNGLGIGPRKTSSSIDGLRVLLGKLLGTRLCFLSSSTRSWLMNQYISEKRITHLKRHLFTGRRSNWEHFRRASSEGRTRET